ncbi:hypothetical protein WJX84_012362 [Apatococcus fuscideae]|uniref:alpha-1,2-Mannosidase n=1 Tax=Apatococcus fuscideae TaxID=2026836 RepID=A0AAW1SU01_9CHLO
MFTLESRQKRQHHWRRHTAAMATLCYLAVTQPPWDVTDATDAKQSAQGSVAEQAAPPQSPHARPPVSSGERDALREEARLMFYHAFNSYMMYAFPKDDLRPISCTGTNSQGGLALTLVDALDTLVVLGDAETLRDAVQKLDQHLDFRIDHRVHVFELTIRALGALLSAHHMLITNQSIMPEYDGSLLRFAHDLGDRLLPAFETPYGVPLSWINLQKGLIPGDLRVTCTACAGTLLLEFGALSRMTGDQLYETLARSAVEVVYGMRSTTTGLLGNTLDVDTLTWVRVDGGVGAGIDSFYEYLLKAYLAFGDPGYLRMFVEVYAAAMQRLQLAGRWASTGWLADMHIGTGQLLHPWISSLSAFWPGLQVLAGQVDDAARMHASWMSAWTAFGGLPELFDISVTQLHPVQRSYPLRPELIESTYLLHSITGDAKYLQAGRTIHETIANKTFQNCGFATVSDLASGQLEDSMESFFLPETSKYLYLLNSDAAALPDYYIFSTEGHLLPPFPRSPADRESVGAQQKRVLEQQRRQGITAMPKNIWNLLASTVTEGLGFGETSGIPSNCLPMCADRKEKDLRKEQRSLRRAFPLLSFSSTKSELLRRRRCTACKAVTGVMQTMAQLSNATAAAPRGGSTVPGAGLIQDLLQRFLPPKVRPGARPAQGLGDTAGDVSFASGEVLQQLLCRIRVDGQGGMHCGQLEDLGTLQIAPSKLPVNSAVLMVRTDDTGVASEAAGSDAIPPEQASIQVRIHHEDDLKVHAQDQNFPAVGAAFGPSLADAAGCIPGSGLYCGMTGKLRVTVPADGCQSLADNVHEVQGAIALLDRGTCMFAEKVQNAAIAGARAAVVVNTMEGGHLIAMGEDEQGTQPPIPAILVDAAAGLKLHAAIQAGDPWVSLSDLGTPFNVPTSDAQPGGSLAQSGISLPKDEPDACTPTPTSQDAAPGAQHTRVEVLVPPQSQAWMAKQPGVTDLQAAMTAVLQAAMTALNPQQSQLFQVPGKSSSFGNSAATTNEHTEL